MLGYIVKILDSKQDVFTNWWPHSVGDYWRVVVNNWHNVRVETAHGTTRWYDREHVEVYARTPIDLILINGKSLPANKSAVNRAMATSGMTFRNTKDLRDTFVSIKNEQERDKAIAFYKERDFNWIWQQPTYDHAHHCYLRANDTDKLYCWLKYKEDMHTIPNNATNITSEVLGVTGATQEQKEYPIEIPATFLPCNNSKPMTEPQTLEQLKFNKYVEENEGDIVDLSESIDDKLEDLNDLGHTCWDLYITVKTQSTAMSNAFKECNKERLIKHQKTLEIYDDLFASKEYKDLVAATKALDKKIEALTSK